MIKKLNVRGMNHRFNYSLEFNEDMNVLTGLNGSGKTTLLMLIWYLISGNLHRIISQIPFTSVEIETSWFDLSMEQTSEGGVKLECTHKSPETVPKTVNLDSKNLTDNLGDLNEQIADVVPGSLFFPTFRRIEMRPIAEQASEALQGAISGFSDALSFKRHKFITTMSMGDINRQLIQEHKRLKQLQDQQDTSDSKHTLEYRWNLLRDIVQDVYDDYKIKISIDIRFEGDTGTWELCSDDLSSGEKQFLGFLCYNAFSPDHLIFLDEPELSLHVDYQRLVLPSSKTHKGQRNSFSLLHIHPLSILSMIIKINMVKEKKLI